MGWCIRIVWFVVYEFMFSIYELDKNEIKEEYEMKNIELNTMIKLFSSQTFQIFFFHFSLHIHHHICSFGAHCDCVFVHAPDCRHRNSVFVFMLPAHHSLLLCVFFFFLYLNSSFQYFPKNPNTHRISQCSDQTNIYKCTTERVKEAVEKNQKWINVYIVGLCFRSWSILQHKEYTPTDR